MSNDTKQQQQSAAPTPPTGTPTVSREWCAWGLNMLAYGVRAGRYAFGQAYAMATTLFTTAHEMDWLCIDEVNTIISTLKASGATENRENYARFLETCALIVESEQGNITVAFEAGGFEDDEDEDDCDDEYDDDEDEYEDDIATGDGELERVTAILSDAKNVEERITVAQAQSDVEVNTARGIVADTIRLAANACESGMMPDRELVKHVNDLALEGVRVGLLDKHQYHLHNARSIAANPVPEREHVVAWANGVAELVCGAPVQAVA